MDYMIWGQCHVQSSDSVMANCGQCCGQCPLLTVLLPNYATLLRTRCFTSSSSLIRGLRAGSGHWGLLLRHLLQLLGHFCSWSTFHRRSKCICVEKLCFTIASEGSRSWISMNLNNHWIKVLHIDAFVKKQLILIRLPIDLTLASAAVPTTTKVDSSAPCQRLNRLC